MLGLENQRLLQLPIVDASVQDLCLTQKLLPEHGLRVQIGTDT